MVQHPVGKLSFGIAALALFLVFGVANANSSLVRAQSSVPDWERAAGADMEFAAVSIKRNLAPSGPADGSHSSVPLDSQGGFAPTGGLFSAVHFGFIGYMTFAYKLTQTQRDRVFAELPAWAKGQSYDIEARADGNPTKDQYRLMMQALLRDRFKLAVHTETRQTQVLALVLNKPGVLGANLKQHADDDACPETARPAGPMTTVKGGYPANCGAFYQMLPEVPSHFRGGARDVTISILADSLEQGWCGLDHSPVVDRTNLTGHYDFLLDFSLKTNGELADPNGSTCIEALTDELGLKFVRQTAPMNFIVIDHIEEPTPN